MFTGFFPIEVLYLLAVLLMKAEPLIQLKSPLEWELYNSDPSSKSLAVVRLKHQFERLEDLMTGGGSTASCRFGPE